MEAFEIPSEFESKKLMIDIGKRLWTRGYVAANDGNISVRISDNEILSTPTGVSKGFMRNDMILKMTMDGEILSQDNQYRPSSEIEMHIEIYKQRNDVKSVIHAHPPYCTGFAVAGIPLDKCVLPEAVITLGAVPIAPYGTPSIKEMADSIRPYIQKGDAILLANHGAITVGIDIVAAYHRMETLEHTAHITYLAMGMGNVNVLSKEQTDKLIKLKDEMDIPGKINTDFS